MQVGQQFNPYRLFVGAFIPNALMQYTGLTQGAKLTWARLAQYAGEKGEAYPSLETLANDIGVKKLQAIQYLKELEKKQFIEVLRASGKDKLLHKTNRYIFLWNSIFNLHTSGGMLKHTSGGMLKHTSGGMLKHTSGGMLKHTSGGMLKHTQRESVERESLKNTHKEEDKKAMCEGEVKKIKKTKTFQSFDTAIMEKIIKKNGKEAVIAAEYIEKTFSGRAIRNPAGLLIKTLERGLYTELPPEKANNLNSEIGKLNAEFKGFTIFRDEKIKEFLNIGGRVAFNTDNCLREMVNTPAKTYEEFKNYLQKINFS